MCAITFSGLKVYFKAVKAMYTLRQENNKLKLNICDDADIISF
jgi:hypothetical protein